MLNKKIVFILVAILLFVSCKKDDTKFDIVPAIEYISITPSNPHQYSDKVIITIHYKDGDGDLGENKDGVKNCFVTDNRIGITYQYRIQQLAPEGSSIPISGNLNIDLGGQVVTDSSSQQNVSYTMYIVDRSGHTSNSITTSSILIIR